MIQRIQTVYVFISLVLMALLLALPLAEIIDGNAVYQLSKLGVSGESGLVKSGWYIAVVTGIVVLVHGIVIFSYKKRVQQIRMLRVAMLLMFVLLGMFYFFSYFSFSNAQISLKIGTVFPLVGMILDYLAIRAIGKDETLIRSIDRIR